MSCDVLKSAVHKARKQYECDSLENFEMYLGLRKNKGTGIYTVNQDEANEAGLTEAEITIIEDHANLGFKILAGEKYVYNFIVFHSEGPLVWRCRQDISKLIMKYELYSED